MAPEMMTRINNPLKKIGVVLFLLFSCSFLSAQENKKWVIAAEKFEYSKGQNAGAVADATAEMLPARILEQLGQRLVRSVTPDERLERFAADSRKERMSLFLQLSSAYKKRDSVVLNNYSPYELKKAIATEEKNIQAIQDKIDENLSKLKNEEEKTEKLKTRKDQAIKNEKLSDSELFKYSSLVKNLFVKDEPVFTSEDVKFYRDDINSLYTPGVEAKKKGYLSYDFEKECVNSGIQTLLTGRITAYGDYVSVAVELYLYPNAKLIGSIMEVGSMQEFDLLASNLARQLLPLVTNAMPVQIKIAIGPENISSEVYLYLDDQLQASFDEVMFIDSGVHTVQFTAEGYRTASTSYYFEGNRQYSIEVMLEELEVGSMLIGIQRPPLDLFIQSLPLTKQYSDTGIIYYNGVRTDYDEQDRSTITINGNKILGQFVSEDGTTDFFYVPEKLISDGAMVSINPKPFDRSEYIDTRRKWMYGSYSVLITSLIPSFYCYGKYSNLAIRWNSLAREGLLTYEDYEEALRMRKMALTTAGISIGCGIFFAYELFRYFEAANTVLPRKAKKTTEVLPVVTPKEEMEPSDQPAEENPESETGDENVEDSTTETETITETLTEDQNITGNETITETTEASVTEE